MKYAQCDWIKHEGVPIHNPPISAPARLLFCLKYLVRLTRVVFIWLPFQMTALQTAKRSAPSPLYLPIQMALSS